MVVWIRVLEGLFGRPEASVPTSADGQMQIWSPWVRERLTGRSPSAEKRGDQGDDTHFLWPYPLS